MSSKVLVSACLLGHPVRYDGRAKTVIHPLLERWIAHGRVVPICPEVAGGLGTPRLPAEIEDGMSGEDVLRGHARVLNSQGSDVTQFFVRGAQIALQLAQANDCRLCVLKDGSPSCGTGHIFDGTFQGARHAGFGVTSALLRQHGILVFSKTQLDQLILE